MKLFYTLQNASFLTEGDIIALQKQEHELVPLTDGTIIESPVLAIFKVVTTHYSSKTEKITLELTTDKNELHAILLDAKAQVYIVSESEFPSSEEPELTQPKKVQAKKTIKG